MASNPLYNSRENFPISFKPKVAKCKENLLFHFLGGRHASFFQKPVVKTFGKTKKRSFNLALNSIATKSNMNTQFFWLFAEKNSSNETIG